MRDQPKLKCGQRDSNIPPPPPPPPPNNAPHRAVCLRIDLKNKLDMKAVKQLPSVAQCRPCGLLVRLRQGDIIRWASRVLAAQKPCCTVNLSGDVVFSGSIFMCDCEQWTQPKLLFLSFSLSGLSIIVPFIQQNAINLLQKGLSLATVIWLDFYCSGRKWMWGSNKDAIGAPWDLGFLLVCLSTLSQRYLSLNNLNATPKVCLSPDPNQK